jgi:hypothetical protein
VGDDRTGDDLYIIGDIHGDLTSLTRELWVRGLWRSGIWRKGAHLICVGDYTDRNRGGVAVLRMLRALEEAGQATCLLGNHDVVMIGTALIIRRHGELPAAFTQPLGTGDAPPDDEEAVVAWLFRSCGAFPRDALAIAGDDGLLAWLRRRPLMMHCADLLIVHADNAHPLDWGTTIHDVNAVGRQVTEGENLTNLLTLFSGLTDRYAFVRDDDALILPGDDRGEQARTAAPSLLNDMLARFGGSTLVHGHSVFSTGDASPLIYAGGQAVNVDRGAGYPQRGGKLCLTSAVEVAALVRRYRETRG